MMPKNSGPEYTPSQKVYQKSGSRIFIAALLRSPPTPPPIGNHPMSINSRLDQGTGCNNTW